MIIKVGVFYVLKDNERTNLILKINKEFDTMKVKKICMRYNFIQTKMEKVK